MEKLQEYPEPQGCTNAPGFVKANPLNNASYLEKSCEVYPQWATILRDTHEKLEALVPGYNIAQIKEKFWTLRFYIDLPVGLDANVAQQAFQIAQDAEMKAPPMK